MGKNLAEQDGYDFFDFMTNALIVRIVPEGDFWDIETMKKAREEFLRQFPDYMFAD